MKYCFQGDYGFTLDFKSQLDLSTIDRVMLLLRTGNNQVIQRELDNQTFNNVGVGDVLSVPIEKTDTAAPGTCSAQVLVRTESAGEGLMELSADPFVFEVQRRIATVNWD